METSYSVVFDIAQVGFRGWTFSTIGLIFVGLGIFFLLLRIWRFKLFRNGWSPSFAKWFIIAWTGLAITFTAIDFSSTYSEYKQLRTAADTGKYETVEGVVTDFVPMPYTGHSNEKFCVNGNCFSYSDYEVTSGFNNTSSHGGPIREGLKVRIHHVNGVIIRLEVVK